MTVAATQAASRPAAGEGEGGERFRGGFDGDARGLAAAEQYRVAADEHLHRAAEERATDDAPFGAFRETHVGETLSDLPLEQDGSDGEFGAFGQFCQQHEDSRGWHLVSIN
jgi:hypothetical protein